MLLTTWPPVWADSVLLESNDEGRTIYSCTLCYCCWIPPKKHWPAKKNIIYMYLICFFRVQIHTDAVRKQMQNKIKDINPIKDEQLRLYFNEIWYKLNWLKPSCKRNLKYLYNHGKICCYKWLHYNVMRIIRIEWMCIRRLPLVVLSVFMHCI